MKPTMKKNCQRKWLKFTQGIRESAHKTRSPFLLVAGAPTLLGTHAQPAPQGGFGGPGGPPPGMMGRIKTGKSSINLMPMETAC